MEKHFKIIIVVAVVILLVFTYLIMDMMFKNNKENIEQTSPANNPVETAANIEDYVITESVAVYADLYAKVNDEQSRILGVLESINTENNQVTGFVVKDIDDNAYELFVKDMSLVNLEYNGDNEVNIAFRTGGNVRMITGSYVYLYKADGDKWSLDESVQYGGEFEQFGGNIVDFEFSSMANQNGHIMLSYIIVEDGTGQRASLPLSVIDIQSAVSKGELVVYYDETAVGDKKYNVRESDNFSIDVIMHDGSAQSFAKGSMATLLRSSKKGYWELYEPVDTNRYKAIVSDIVFGHDDKNITGIDYLVLSLEDGTKTNMTIMQTQAVSGKPFGNYQRIYRYNGNSIAISDVEPTSEWRMELNYANGTKITIRLGTEIWVSKNLDNLYMMDYEYTYTMHESQEDK